MGLPRLIVTGSSGFVGRHLLDALKERYRIVGIARRTQSRSGAPVHPNITWHQADVGDRLGIEQAFDRIRLRRDDVVVHLAAHYDFTGERHPEYFRTNVDGLRNVLELCRWRRPRRFVFSSSVAACSFPDAGGVVDETSPPTGRHVYAETKRLGEEMLREYDDAFPSTIVRFAALFSDWCEYPPLFMFLGTWLSDVWNARVLGGRGESAIPYLHIRDGTAFLERVLETVDRPPSGAVLVASPDGAVSHRELFDEATRDWYGQPRRPLHMPRALCGPGMRLMLLAGRLRGELPFERPWMARYVDRRLTVSASRTREALDWAPRERLAILRRLPFLMTNLKTDPAGWNQRNRAALKAVHVRPNLLIHRLLEKHEPRISEELTARMTASHDPRFVAYRRIAEHERRWNHRVVLRHLMNTILTRERTLFLSYCRDLAEHRRHQGFRADDVVAALLELDRVCVECLRADPESAPVLPYLRDFVTMNIRYGADQVLDTFETSHG